MFGMFKQAGVEFHDLVRSAADFNVDPAPPKALVISLRLLSTIVDYNETDRRTFGGRVYH